MLARTPSAADVCSRDCPALWANGPAVLSDLAQVGKRLGGRIRGDSEGVGDFCGREGSQEKQAMRYDAADKWLKTRLQMPTALSSRGLADIDPAIRANAFFSAQVAVGHVLDTLRDVSDRFTKGEMNLATARLELKRRLGKQYEPGTSDDRRLSNLAFTARLDLILRQNARMAMAVGEYQQGMDPMTRKMFPYWRYVKSTSASPRGASQVLGEGIQEGRSYLASHLPALRVQLQVQRGGGCRR